MKSCVAAGSEVQLARGARDGELYIWLADDSAPATGQKSAAHQQAACHAAIPSSGTARDSSTGGSTQHDTAMAGSGESSYSGQTAPVEAAQPINQWLDLRPADMQYSSPALCHAEPSCEAEECSRPPATEELAAGLDAVQPPPAVPEPSGLGAVPPAGGMLAVVDPLKAFRLSSAAVQLLFPAWAGSAALLPSQVALTFLVGRPGKVGRHTAFLLQH